MKSPYGDARLCAELDTEVLEDTFHYPGPNVVGKKPSATAQERYEVAKEVCIECPVFLSCRAEHWGEEFGVYGGTDQYERYLYRRRQQRMMLRQDDAERAALAASIHAERGAVSGWRVEVIARRTGLSTFVVKTLVAEHQAVLDAERQRVALERETHGPEGRHPWRGNIAA